MPYKAYDVDLTPGGTIPVIPPGAAINGISITDAPAAVRYRLLIGNNPPTSYLTGVPTITFGAGVPDTDLREGLKVLVDAPVPNAVISMTVSFR